MNPTQTVATGELTEELALEAAAQWVADFDAALAGGAKDLEGLFIEGATWRDFMAFSWDVSNRIGRDELVERLADWAQRSRPEALQLDDDFACHIFEGSSIQAFFTFVTDERVCRGYALLVPDAGGFACSMLQTQADGLQRFPELTGENRAQGKVHGYVENRSRWSRDREEEAAFEHSEPAVVILGAGHNGLSVAARLKALDVPTLVIDRYPRVGDVWRKRYAALALHSILHVDHLPYLSFPKTWTAHTPKDKLADFLEYYSKALDLNVWNGTTFKDAEYDEEHEVWTIRVEREDGSIREIHPRHFIVTAGLNGPPKIPAIEGLDSFAGEWSHSGEYQNAAEWSGKRVLVVGSGVSAHEMSHDLYEHGADVTMLQRGATYVIDFDTFNKYWFGLYTEQQELPIERADQVAYSVPNVVGDEINRQLVELAKEEDKELLDALESQGFKLEWGPDGTGIIGAHMMGRDSYQINIGASELVADGRVKLKGGAEVAEVKGNTVVYTDGDQADFDLILFATGYEQLWDYMGPTLGKAAEKIPKVYGRAPDNEYANVWRRSAQPGLWFGTGFVGMARFHSKFMTLLIKAIEEGIQPIDPDR